MSNRGQSWFMYSLAAMVSVAIAGCGPDERTSPGSDGGTGESSDARKVCEAHCACEGCAGTWIDDCTHLREQNRPGCEAQWDALYACLVEKMACNMGSFLTEGCGLEDTALRDCVMAQ